MDTANLAIRYATQNNHVAQNNPARQKSATAPETSSIIERINALCDAGLCHDAYHFGVEHFGELTGWPGAEGQDVAIRVASLCGAKRIANVLQWRAFKRWPDNWYIRLNQARKILNTKGTYHGWEFMQSRQPDEQVPAPLRAEYYSLMSYIHGLLRDFDTAKTYFEKAQSLDPASLWIPVEQSYVDEMRDDFRQGLERCLQVLKKHPSYRSAIQMAAHFDVLLGEGDNAIARLFAAQKIMQMPGMSSQLEGLLTTSQRYEEALRQLDNIESLLLPELVRYEKNIYCDWLASRRCDIACLQSDYQQALEQAKKVTHNKFYQAVAERLAESTKVRPVKLLNVEFVSQHYMTCAPATLTALSLYWGKKVEHSEIAKAISYDGTRPYDEVIWCQQQGWLVKEFTVTWESTVALIDRGIPFSLATQGPTNGHLQTIIGYDPMRGSLLIRDPDQTSYAEFLADGFFKSQASSGPRGMLILPYDQQDKLAGITLPDNALWELYHQFTGALRHHQRDTALALAETLGQLAPDHLIHLNAQRDIAAYDGNEIQHIAMLDKLLAQYPDTDQFMIAKSALLSTAVSKAEQQCWLDKITSSPDASSHLQLYYAQYLLDDNSQIETAKQLILKAIDKTSDPSKAWALLGAVEWTLGKPEKAEQLYYLASTQNRTSEYYARQYLNASRFNGHLSDGLNYLMRRVENLGERSCYPAMTLSNIYDELRYTQKDTDLLNAAMQQHQDDSELLLFVADRYISYGLYSQAEEILQRAENSSRRADWLYGKASLASARNNDDPQLLAQLQEVLERDPFNIRLQRLYTHLLQRQRGMDAVIDHLRQTTQRYPYHRELNHMLIGWMWQKSPQEIEQQLRLIVDSDPLYAWALRELTVNLTRQQRYKEAHQFNDRALKLDDKNPQALSTSAYLCLQEGNREAAFDYLRAAIISDVDDEYAPEVLISSCTSLEERQKELRFYLEQLRTRPLYGNGLLTFQRLARNTLEPEETLAHLHTFLNERNDLWQIWVALIIQLRSMSQYTLGEKMAQDAIDAFPMLPRLYFEKALLYYYQQRYTDCRETLEKALAINPWLSSIIRLFVDATAEENQDLEPAREKLENYLKHSPDDNELQTWYAFILGRMDRLEETFPVLQKTLLNEPDNDWGWSLLAHYSNQLDNPDYPLELAREIVRQRPHNADGWYALAEMTDDEDEKEQALKHITSTLYPRHQGAWEKLFELFIDQERYDELRLHLEKTPWQENLPMNLQVYEARLLYAQSQLDLAVEKILSLLTRDNNNYELWKILADWREEQQNFPGYVEATREMVRLAPHSHIAHGFLAHALQLNNQKETAAEEFALAWGLDHDYRFAGGNLFRLQLEQQRFPEAMETFRQLFERTDKLEEHLVIEAFELLQHCPDDDILQPLIPRLIEGKRINPDDWRKAAKSLTEPDMKKYLDEERELAIQEGRASNSTIRVWLEEAFRQKDWLEQIDRMMASAGEKPFRDELMEFLGDEGNEERLSIVLQRYKAAYTEDAFSWGLVGYALSTLEKHSEAINWLQNWQQYDAPVWAISNFILSCFALGEYQQSTAAVEYALAQQPGNDEILLWSAALSALRNDPNDVQTTLTRIDTEKMRSFYQAIFILLCSWLEAKHTRKRRLPSAGLKQANEMAGQGNSTYPKLRRKLRFNLFFKG